jgi:hypothetical protein
MIDHPGMIDHPLLEVERQLASGMLTEGFLERTKAEFQAGPRTSAAVRATIFELMGPDFRGRVPVLIESVEDMDEDGTTYWIIVGCIDDSSVLRLADGAIFGGVTLPAVREMVAFCVDSDFAAELQQELDEGREPVLALDPVRLLPLGDEAAFRAFVDADEEPT